MEHGFKVYKFTNLNFPNDNLTVNIYANEYCNQNQLQLLLRTSTYAIIVPVVGASLCAIAGCSSFPFISLNVATYLSKIQSVSCGPPFASGWNCTDPIGLES